MFCRWSKTVHWTQRQNLTLTITFCIVAFCSWQSCFLRYCKEDGETSSIPNFTHHNQLVLHTPAFSVRFSKVAAPSIIKFSECFMSRRDKRIMAHVFPWEDFIWAIDCRVSSIEEITFSNPEPKEVVAHWHFPSVQYGDACSWTKDIIQVFE